MNKDAAINILLDFSKNYDKDWYAVDKDKLTSAIIFLEKDLHSRKKDAKVEIKGISFDIRKGV